MGIKLDWEVESEGGWSEVGEDARVLAARRQRARRIRTMLLSALGVALVAGAIIGYRLYLVGQEVRAALESTIAAETLALRIGDRQAFLSLQSDVGGWQEIQANAFDQYQSEGARVQVSGQIVEMEISANRARVALRETLDGVDYHVLWFYQRDEKGWKHIPPAASFWGEQQQKGSAHFDFTYYEEDETLAEALIVQMNGWWETACRLTECAGGPVRVQVRIEPDPLATVDWAAYNASTLIIPSPLLGRVWADGSLDPALVGRLADLIAGRWAEYTLARPACQQDDAACPYSDLAWLEEEIRRWLRQSFDGGGAGAPLVGPLAETYGQAVVLQFMGRVKSGEEVGPALKELTGVEPIDLPVGWELYFTYRLRAETALRAAGHATEAGLIYSDYMRQGTLSGIRPILVDADLDSLDIVGLYRFGSILWAETHFRFASSSTSTSEVSDWVSYEPYRLLDDGRWAHTEPGLRGDYGETIEERGQYVTLGYLDVDAPFFVGSLSHLAQIHARLTSDLGVSPSDLSLEISAGGNEERVSEVENTVPDFNRWNWDTETQLTIWFYSPRSYLYPADQTPQDYIQTELIRSLIAEVVYHLAGPLEQHPLALAIIRWEEKRLNLEPTTYPLGAVIGDYAVNATLGSGSYRTPPETLENVWLPVQTVSASTAYATRDYVAADVLLNLLAEKYGPQAIAPLMQNLAASTSMDDWLSRSLGIHASDIEAEWHTRTATAVSALP